MNNRNRKAHNPLVLSLFLLSALVLSACGSSSSDSPAAAVVTNSNDEGSGNPESNNAGADATGTETGNETEETIAPSPGSGGSSVIPGPPADTEGSGSTGGTETSMETETSTGDGAESGDGSETTGDGTDTNGDGMGTDAETPAPGFAVNGFIVKESINYNDQGIATSTVRYTYDFDLKSISKKEIQLSDGVESFLADSTYTYNAAGNPILSTQLDESGEVVAASSFNYNSQGLLAYIENNVPSNNSRETMSYDSNGNLIMRDAVNTETGDVIFTVNYTLREDGQPASSETVFDGGSRVDTMQYDQQNRKIGFTGGDSSSSEEYVYDENGNMVTKMFYGFDGSLISTRNFTYEATDEVIYNSILWFYQIYR